MDQRTCAWCGDLYTPKRRDQRMCGGYCSTRYPEARAVPRDSIACACCGDLFVPAHGAHRYCGRRCRDAASRPARFSEQRCCAWCASSFTATQPSGKYCSRSCKSAGNGQQWQARQPGGSAGYWYRYNRSAARRRWLSEHADVQREQTRVRNRAFRQAHPDIERARYARYREQHRDAFRQRQSLRRALKVDGADCVPIAERDWQRLVRRYRFCCAYCGTRPDKLQVDHVIPIARGGRHGIGNVLPACGPCNGSKWAYFLVEWRLKQARERAEKEGEAA